MACYSAQVTVLERSWHGGGVSDAFAPEQYWRIAAPAPLAGSLARSGGQSTHGHGH